MENNKSTITTEMLLDYEFSYYIKYVRNYETILWILRWVPRDEFGTKFTAWLILNIINYKIGTTFIRDIIEKCKEKYKMNTDTDLMDFAKIIGKNNEDDPIYIQTEKDYITRYESEFLKKTLCKFFINGECNRGINCGFSHHPSKIWIKICNLIGWETYYYYNDDFSYKNYGLIFHLSRDLKYNFNVKISVPKIEQVKMGQECKIEITGNKNDVIEYVKILKEKLFEHTNNNFLERIRKKYCKNINLETHKRSKSYNSDDTNDSREKTLKAHKRRYDSDDTNDSRGRTPETHKRSKSYDSREKTPETHKRSKSYDSRGRTPETHKRSKSYDSDNTNDSRNKREKTRETHKSKSYDSDNTNDSRNKREKTPETHKKNKSYDSRGRTPETHKKNKSYDSRGRTPETQSESYDLDNIRNNRYYNNSKDIKLYDPDNTDNINNLDDLDKLNVKLIIKKYRKKSGKYTTKRILNDSNRIDLKETELPRKKQYINIDKNDKLSDMNSDMYYYIPLFKIDWDEIGKNPQDPIYQLCKKKEITEKEYTRTTICPHFKEGHKYCKYNEECIYSHHPEKMINYSHQVTYNCWTRDEFILWGLCFSHNYISTDKIPFDGKTFREKLIKKITNIYEQKISQEIIDILNAHIIWLESDTHIKEMNNKKTDNEIYTALMQMPEINRKETILKIIQDVPIGILEHTIQYKKWINKPTDNNNTSSSSSSWMYNPNNSMIYNMYPQDHPVIIHNIPSWTNNNISI